MLRKLSNGCSVELAKYSNCPIIRQFQGHEKQSRLYNCKEDALRYDTHELYPSQCRCHASRDEN